MSNLRLTIKITGQNLQCTVSIFLEMRLTFAHKAPIITIKSLMNYVFSTI